MIEIMKARSRGRQEIHFQVSPSGRTTQLPMTVARTVLSCQTMACGKWQHVTADMALSAKKFQVGFVEIFIIFITNICKYM